MEKKEKATSPVSGGHDADSSKKTDDALQVEDDELNKVSSDHLIVRPTVPPHPYFKWPASYFPDVPMSFLSQERNKRLQQQLECKFSGEGAQDELPRKIVHSSAGISYSTSLFQSWLPWLPPLSRPPLPFVFKKTGDALQAEKEELSVDINESLYKYHGSRPSFLGPSLKERLADVQRHSMKRIHTGECVSEHGSPSSSFLNPPYFSNQSTSSQYTNPFDTDSLYSEKSPAVGQGFTYSIGENLKNDARGLLMPSAGCCGPGGDHSAVEEKGPPVTAELYSPENSLDIYSPRQRYAGSFKRRTKDSNLPSYSASALSQIPSAENKTFTGEKSSSDTLSQQRSDEFTPDITAASTTDDMLEELSPGTLTETRMRKKCSSAAGFIPGVTQDNTRQMEPHEYEYGSCSSYWLPHAFNRYLSGPFQTVAAHPQVRPTVLQDSPVCTKRSRTQDAFELLSVQSERQPGEDSEALVEMEVPVTAVNYSVTNTLPAHSHLQMFSSDPGWSRRDSSCLPRSPSLPSLSQITSAENNTLTRAESFPDMLLKSSIEEFTPDITADENDDTYRFQCSCPGLYQCSVTGLVFHMEGEGDVVYRIVPWNRRLLAQHHQKPAGPLFDIKCVQQSVCQLHLPHCEIRSTGGWQFLSVAHMNDEGIEFISPHKITETHVIINITRFSAFGNVKDEDSPPDPVRALVLLFYRPPADPDLTSLLNVLLLPRNAVLRDVMRIRKKLVGDESYIETSPHCKLLPKQEYTLSTCPEDDSVLVQPTEAEFDCDNYDNYFPSFQMSLEKIMKHMKLFLRDTNSSHSVWERRVCLSSTGVRRSCGPSALNLPPNERLLDIRSSFIDGISGPVLKSLLDKLLEKKVMNDSERESADVIQNQRDKARFVIDSVRKKGEAASSEMIDFLCEADPFLCEHLGLI